MNHHCRSSPCWWRANVPPPFDESRNPLAGAGFLAIRPLGRGSRPSNAFALINGFALITTQLS
jgi:hypothetical protein